MEQQGKPKRETREDILREIRELLKGKTLRELWTIRAYVKALRE